jgi:hypothetical protein
LTFYEHGMLGGTLALALGSHRRHGWPIVFMAGIAGALPDWDALSLAFGPVAYSTVHRVWGHNLLAVVLGGSVVGGLGLLCLHSVRIRTGVQQLLAKLGQPATAQQTPPSFSVPTLAVWMAIGVLAGLSHLPADLIYGGSPGTPDWPLPLLWPFSQRQWAIPLLSWGDLGPTLLFLAEMFALYRWPALAVLIAWLTLIALLSYLASRWLVTTLA